MGTAGPLHHTSSISRYIARTQILNASHNIVVSAPTGCGKTAVMELAIVALLKRLDYHPGGSSHAIKIVYSEIGDG